MYHYIRDGINEDKYFRYLPFTQFCKQLDYLEQNFGFVSRQDFDAFIRKEKKASQLSGVILTFDDGLKEHYSLVLAELINRGLWGCFYIPTNIFKNTMLPVHIVHFLIGRIGAKALADSITEKFLLDVRNILPSLAYQAQMSSGLDEKACKYLINYYLSVEDSTHLCFQLLDYFNIDQHELNKRWYVNFEEVIALVESNMVVGAHSCSHTLLTKLSKKEIQQEISCSLNTLKKITNNNNCSFCFPFGGEQSYDKFTLKTLADNNSPFCFDVKEEDITDNHDLLCLLRYDCNQFKFGT